MARSQPYRLDWSGISTLTDLLTRLPNIISMADEMFQILFEDMENAGGTVTGAELSKVDDTNVTLTLGGSPTAALLTAVSLTLGWSGRLAYSRFIAATAASRLVGRRSGSSGDFEEVSLGTGLSMSAGAVLSATNTLSIAQVMTRVFHKM